MKYKKLYELYKEMYEITWNHFIDANEIVLDHCYDDEVLDNYNEEDEVFCHNLKQLEKEAKELEKHK